MNFRICLMVILSICLQFMLVGQGGNSGGNAGGNSSDNSGGNSTQATYDAFVDEVKSKAKDKYSYSQFAIALRYRDSLALSTPQIDQMYDEVKTLKEMKNAHYEQAHTSLDTRSYESGRMVELLTEDQYDLLLRLKNHTKARSKSDNDWSELELRGLAAEFNQSSTKEELYEYYLKLDSLYDKYRHDPITQYKEAHSHKCNSKPLALIKLIKARQSPDNDTLGEELDGGK